MCVYIYFCLFQWKHFRCIFESGHIVDYICAWFGIILVSNRYFQTDVFLGVFQLLRSHKDALLIYLLYCPNFYFWPFLFFLLSLLNFCWVVFYHRFLGWCTCWIPSWHESTIGTIGGSTLVNDRFVYDECLVWVSSCFTCLSFYCYALLNGILVGTDGEFSFQIFMLGVSMIPCDNLLVWLVGWQVMDSVVHELNPMRHELLHLWRTFLAC